MISIPQIELNVCRAYIRHVKERFAIGAYANRYLQILEIRQGQLLLKLLNLPITSKQIATLEQGISLATQLLAEINDGPNWIAREIADVLCSLIVEMSQTIRTSRNRSPSDTHTMQRPIGTHAGQKPSNQTIKENPMPIEFANRTIRSRAGVKPPTQAEYAIAKSKGFETISGEQLVQMRSQAKVTRPAVPAKSTVAASTTPSDAAMIKKLTRQVERLHNENCNLKLKLMTVS